MLAQLKSMLLIKTRQSGGRKCCAHAQSFSSSYVIQLVNRTAGHQCVLLLRTSMTETFGNAARLVWFSVVKDALKC